VVTSAGASSVGTFGGSGTTSADVVRNAAGDYTVTFTGSYPAAITPSALATLASAQGNLQQASGVVLTATTTSISVEVFTFAYVADAGEVDTDDDFALAVDLGQ
jgi:hypothetical protein